MRIVVTGAHGQIVTALKLRAADTDVEIVSLGRPVLDLEHPETIAGPLEASAPDIVIAAAAYTDVDGAEGEPERAHTINAVASGVMSQATARLGVPIIYLSTDYVYDGGKTSPYLETDRTGPRSVYGKTKLAGEQAVAAANPSHVIARTAWVFSPFGKNFVRTMLELAKTRDAIPVVADQIGNPTFACDAADALIAIARKLRAGDGPVGVYNMAGTGDASWAGFAQAIFHGAQARSAPFAQVRPIPSAEYPRPAPRPANSRLDTAKLKLDYDIALPTWASALDRCLDVLCGDVRGDRG